MRIYYGTEEHNIELNNLWHSKVSLFIPPGDIQRLHYFGCTDPAEGVEKNIYVIDDFGATMTYSANTCGIIFKNEDGKYDLKQTAIIKPHPSHIIANSVVFPTYIHSLQRLHTSLHLNGGSWADELNEQLMSMKYISPDACVLELGSNIGRNTCVIASKLRDSSKLVTVESFPETIGILYGNKIANGFDFTIECGAISNTPMAQKDWVCVPYDGVTVPDGHVNVPTISWKNFKEKHSLPFDTLVADCEGALYNIIKENPDFLDGIKTVIVENDYRDKSHKTFVDDAFIAHGLEVLDTIPLETTSDWVACADCFYEVWQVAAKK